MKHVVFDVVDDRLDLTIQLEGYEPSMALAELAKAKDLICSYFNLEGDSESGCQLNALSTSDGQFATRQEEFQSLSLVQLELLTGIDRPRWSRYLTGKVSMTESTLRQAAKGLSMKPEDLLKAIEQRREEIQIKE